MWVRMPQLVLGHSIASVTDAVYAERDTAKVIEVMEEDWVRSAEGLHPVSVRE